MENHFLFEDGDHFISNLQIVDANIRHKRKDETNVRLIVIGIHDALFALLIDKFTRTDGFGIFRRDFEDKVRQFYDKGFSSNDPEFIELAEGSFNQPVASLGDLLFRIKLPSGTVLPKEIDEELQRPERGLKRIKEFRDYLAHPRPMLSAYYEDFLIEALQDTVSVIREVLKNPSKVIDRHDTKEAEILLSSIEYYIEKWAVFAQDQDSN